MLEEANPGYHRHLGATPAMTAVAAASPAQQNEGTKACGWRGQAGRFNFPEEELTHSVHHWKGLPPGRGEPLLLGLCKQGALARALRGFQALSLGNLTIIKAVPTPYPLARSVTRRLKYQFLSPLQSPLLLHPTVGSLCSPRSLVTSQPKAVESHLISLVLPAAPLPLTVPAL